MNEFHVSRRLFCQGLAAGAAATLSPVAFSKPAPMEFHDWRDIRHGVPIPDENYCDQPYAVWLEEGRWLLTMTTGPGREGDRRQHIVSLRSDHETLHDWSEPVDIEPADGPEASWAVPFRTPSGRVYVFYTYNDSGITDRRADLLGSYVFKFSDDGGHSWSSERYKIPVRTTEYDRTNDFGGRIKMGWGVGKPIVIGDSVYIPWSKIGRYPVDQSEGWIFRSDNLLTETDPAKIRWRMLPDGDVGLRAPEGPIAEEQHIAPLQDGSIYCIYRTTRGHPAHAYSRDGGVSWTKPAYADYSPGGRLIKHPRACPAMERMDNGKYLLWFHNHSGRSFKGRNPVWLSGGIEKQGHIHWSQPEIVLYHRDPNVRISYPDFVERDGEYLFTETQKTTARWHGIRSRLLRHLWGQHQASKVTERGLKLFAVRSRAHRALQGESYLSQPLRRNLSRDDGFSLELWFQLDDLEAGQVMLDSRSKRGAGILATTEDDDNVRLRISDGFRTAECESDPGSLTAGRLHHVVMTVDGGAKVISIVLDGRLCDGGPKRRQGWTRFDPEMSYVGGAKDLQVAPSLNGRILLLRTYIHYLLTSEAIGNYRAGLPPLERKESRED